MLLQGCNRLSSYSSSQLFLLSPKSQRCSSQRRQPFRTRKDKSSVCVASSVIGFNEIADVAHNKVLIAATVSAAIGQLSKPFTSVILYGKRNEFDIKTAFQSGGFPSTHSSAVVATATSLGLERGFSDAIFGLAVVYASLIMYDAQGVRREVGIHAKALNEIIAHQSSFSPNDNSSSRPTKPFLNSESSLEPRVLISEANPMESSSMKTANKLVSDSDNKMAGSNVEVRESGESIKRLKESVGHTEIEVIAGALLGFFVSLALYTIS